MIGTVRSRVISLVVMCGCGRIGFDPVGGTKTDARGPVAACAGPITRANNNAAYSIALGDLDGDGHLDVAIGSYDYAATAAGDGAGNFGALIDGPTFAGAADALAIGDVDGDRKADIVVATAAGAAAVVLHGTGDDQYTVGATYTAPDQCQTVRLADLDRDGSLDLVAGEYTTKQQSVWLNNAGAFGARADYTTSGETSDVAVADLDGDGVLDLVVGMAGDHGVAIARGNGDGSFSASVDYGVGHTAASVAIADIDLDGKLDIAFADGTSATFSVLLGNGDLTFRSPISTPTSTALWSIAVLDIDGDGAPDVVVAPLSATIEVYRGAGDGTFTHVRDITTAGQAGGTDTFAVGDLDRDGWPDVVAATNQSFTIIGNGCLR
jgi:hypothetical protein